MRKHNDKAETLRNEQFMAALSPQLQALRCYIAGQVRNIADVDGRVQDTIVEALKSFTSFRGDSCFRTWLFAIAKHQIAHYYRNPVNNIECLPLNDDILSPGFPEEDCCYRALREQELLDAISALPDRYQEVLELHAIESLDHAEIGRQLNMTENAVNALLARARAKLKHIT